MSDQNKAYALGLSAVFFWATVAVAFKLSLAWFSPAQLVFFSSLSSCVVLFIILGLQKKLASLRGTRWKDIRSALFFGALNPFIYYLILFKAYDLLTAQEAQVINYTWALTMALLAVPLLGQALRRQDIIAALLCYFGVLVIATRGNFTDIQFSNLSGVLLALLSTLIWALYWIFNTRDTRPPVRGLLLNFIMALPMITLYCWLTGEFENIKWQGIGGAIYIGIFEMGLTFVLWLNAMKYTKSTAKIANLIFLSPMLSLLFIYFFLGETIYTSTLYGLALILSGLAIQQWSGKKAD